MKTFEFKKLELEDDRSWFKRTFTSKHFIKTLVYVVMGAIFGYVFYYFSDNRSADMLWSEEAFNNVFWGMALGLFITNSPCARGRC